MPQEMTENPLSQALAWSGTLQRLLQGNPDFGRWLQDACHTMITPERLEVWFEELAGEHPPTVFWKSATAKKSSGNSESEPFSLQWYVIWLAWETFRKL